MSGKEIERNWNKEMEKRNFIRWYRNVTPKEIKKVKGEEKRILEWLFVEHTDEIDMINKSKYHTNLYPNQNLKI